MRKNRAGVTPLAALGAPKCDRDCPEPPAVLGTDPCATWCRVALGAVHDHCAACWVTLRLDNTGAWVIEVFPSLLCNRMSEHVHLYIKLKLVIFPFICYISHTKEMVSN